MRKKLVVLFVFGLIYNTAFSCDLCTVYIGIQPNDFKNSFTVRHRYRLFKRDFKVNEPFYTTKSALRIKGEGNDKHIGNGASINNSDKEYKYTEAYKSYEVAANIYLSKKFQLNTSLSFSDNYIYQDDSITNTVGGVGDLNLILKFRLFNSVKTEDSTSSKKILNRVIIGGGFTLPTGSYNKESVVGFETEFKPNTVIGTPILELDPHLQAGSGAYSMLFLLEHLIKFNSVGLNTNISYKINTTNKNDFRFANRFNMNSALFMIGSLSKKVKLMTKIGLAYEYSNRDTFKDKMYLDSGGDVLFLDYGVNLYINKLSVEFSYFQPINEYLMGIQPYNSKRIITQLTYYF